PDWHAMAPIVTVYFGASATLFALGRFAPRWRFLTLYGPAAVDVPFVFWIVTRALETSPTPREASQFTIGVFAVLVIFAMVSLSKKTIWAAAALGAIGEALLLRQARVTADTQTAGAVILAVAAAGSAYVVGR